MVVPASYPWVLKSRVDREILLYFPAETLLARMHGLDELSP